MGALVGRLLRSRGWRTWSRVGQTRGGILAAGIAFFGVFSLFPLLVLGFAVAGIVVGGNQRLQDEIVGLAVQALPGVIGRSADSDALVSAEELLATATSTTVVGLSAALGVLTVLYTGLGWIGALREGIRAMFEAPVMELDPVRAKLYDLAVLLTLGILIVATALVSVVTQAFTEELLQLVGLEGSAVGNVVTSSVAFVVVVGLNTALFTVLYRVLAHRSKAWREVAGGALLAAVGVAVLQVLVGVVLGNVGGGLGFLSAFVPVLALFVWLNLNARVMLLGAAWVAVGPTPEPGPSAAEVEAAEQAARALEPAPPLPPVLPARWTDRAVLGAGVVLGATSVALLQATGGALRAATAGLRRVARDD